MSEVKFEIKKGNDGYETVLQEEGKEPITHFVQNAKNAINPVGFRFKLKKDGSLESHEGRVLSAAPFSACVLYKRGDIVYNKIEIVNGKGEDGDRYVAKVIGTEDYRKLVGASTEELHFDLNKSAVSFHIEHDIEDGDHTYYLKISAR